MHQLAAYLKEVEDFDSIVTEGGFASYRISGEECYIKDIWVSRDFRNRDIASVMADQISELAKKLGCKYLSGSVSTLAKNPTASTKVLLAYGFKISGAINGGILFRKDL